MFDQSVPPAAGSKGTVPMTCYVAGKRVEQARPKGRIVGKDQPRQPYRDLALLPDGRVLVGYRGRYITSPFGLQVRGGGDLALTAALPDAAGPFSLRGDGLLLASTPAAEQQAVLPAGGATDRLPPGQHKPKRRRARGPRG
jgi:hypothetical protein